MPPFTPSSTEAVQYADNNLRKVVTDNLAIILRDKPDNPLTQLARLLKKQSLEQLDVEESVKVHVDGIDVTLTHQCSKSEIILSKHFLYGLHMPNAIQWKNIIQFIRDEHPNITNINMIIEVEDPGADLVFLKGTPFYGDLTQKRLIRRRAALSKSTLISGNLSKLSEELNGVRKKHCSSNHRTSPSKTDDINQSLKNRLTSDIINSPAFSDNTESKMLSIAAWSSSTPNPSEEYNIGTSPDVSGCDALLTALDNNIEPMSFHSVLESVLNVQDGGFCVTPLILQHEDLMNSPLIIYDKIDEMMGKQDTLSVDPVLVVSFRSNKLSWRRVMAIAYAAVHPILEYRAIQCSATFALEMSRSLDRYSMGARNHIEYWNKVILARAARDAKRVENDNEIRKQKAKSLNMEKSLSNRSSNQTPRNSCHSGDDEWTQSVSKDNVDIPPLAHMFSDSEIKYRQLAREKRERRRLREDIIYNRVDAFEKVRNAIRIQAVVRGHLIRMKIKALPMYNISQEYNNKKTTYNKFDTNESNHVDAPAIIRRVYYQSLKLSPGFLTTRIPAPRLPAIRHKYWSASKRYISPQYDGDVSSDEEHFEERQVIVPPLAESQRPRMFNPFERLNQINQLCQCDDYEWMLSVVLHFRGVSNLQRRAYEVIIQHTLDFLHVVFLEKHHRRHYTYGLSEYMTFSEYINSFFSEFITWSSMPHFVSLSTSTDSPIPLLHGPDNPLKDRILYQSTSPTILPWGKLAPITGGDDSDWFLPHWNDEIPVRVFTTADFAPVAVWKKQIDYATCNDQPLWWFSLCPEIGLYVNAQPFIAAGRPLLQDVEGFYPGTSLDPLIRMSNDRFTRWDYLVESNRNFDGSTSGHKLEQQNPLENVMTGVCDETFKTSNINNHTTMDHSSEFTAFREHEKLDTNEHEFGWFGVHWTEMEHRLRSLVIHDAKSNQFHVTAYTIPKPNSVNANSISTTQTATSKEDVNSDQSDPNTVTDGCLNLNAFVSPECITITNDTHEFSSSVSYAEAQSAEKVVMAVTNIIPPQKPVTTEGCHTPDNTDSGTKSNSRRVTRTSSEKEEGRARSIRRLKSLSSSSRDNGTSTGLKRQGSNGGLSGRWGSMTVKTVDDGGKTSFNQQTCYPTLSDIPKRVRTSQKVSEILLKSPKSRYVRCPALEVGGYHWWCNVERFISVVHRGLRNGANIAIGITGESQFFYSIAALLVAHTNFAESDEIENTYMRAQKNRVELLLKEKQRQEAEKRAKRDPADLGLRGDTVSMTGSERSSDIANADRHIPVDPLSDDALYTNIITHDENMLSCCDSNTPLRYFDKFAQLCAQVFEKDMTHTLAVFNTFITSTGVEYYHGGIKSDIASAERATDQIDVRNYIIEVVRKSERYCGLLLVYLFLKELPPGEGTTELPSLVSWVFHPDKRRITEWINTIDPWDGFEARSPDPFHLRYSNIHKRWMERTFVSKAY